MEQVVDRANMMAALKKVKGNKGAAGVDGMTVDELSEYLVLEWERIKKELLSDKYLPSPIRQHEIEKPDGGTRVLGIPTVVDRLIQQAILQVMQPVIDPTFSTHSYGYRPNRSALDAVAAARSFIQAGKTWVVDVDLASFFDRVNHDILMSRVAKRVQDKRILRIIRRFLTAGMMANGVIAERKEETPQGSPLSPLLANLLLDEVDKELEKRGLAFCRYADDCNVYVSSSRAGHDAMASLRKLYGRLQLSINDTKSAVARPWERKFLGYSFHARANGTIIPAVASKSLERMKNKVRAITRTGRGKKLQTTIDELGKFLPGWRRYYRLTPEKEIFRKLDGWIAARLRALLFIHWKRGVTMFTRLRALGNTPVVSKTVANRASRHRWQTANLPVSRRAIPDAYFRRLGVPMLAV
jgi:group II intron reverse transcriptase/maturase